MQLKGYGYNSGLMSAINGRNNIKLLFSKHTYISKQIFQWASQVNCKASEHIRGRINRQIGLGRTEPGSCVRIRNTYLTESIPITGTRRPFDLYGYGFWTF